jgi:hypothetical protein
LYLIAGDLMPGLTLASFVVFSNYYRIILMLIVTSLVLFSKNNDVIVGASLLLLAHFITYVRVWEYSTSGITVIGVLLYPVMEKEKDRISHVIILLSIFVLALPSPYIFWADIKNLADFPRYASYLIVLSKVVPTLALFMVCVVNVGKDGFDKPAQILRNIVYKEKTYLTN